MKLEKINDHQIRCTLTSEDLSERELKLSELAYGSEKAKTLFRDMMQQAAYEFGFEAEEIPLMIEAIPVSAECIVLIITKVDDPEELDSRFSNFSNDNPNGKEVVPAETVSVEGADGILDLYRKIQEEKKRIEREKAAAASTSDKTILTDSQTTKKAPAKVEKHVKQSEPAPFDLTRIYTFQDLDTITELAHVLNGYYDGSNTLYKNPEKKSFVLIVNKSEHTPEDFNKVCNIISEYGLQQQYSAATKAFLEEHCEAIIRERALQILDTI